MLSAEQLAAALGKARREGSGWRCLCPAHDDHDPSLSVTEKNGVVLFTCRAGCDQSTVVETLKQRGLWGPTRSEPNDQQFSATYDYTDETGRLLFRVHRRGRRKQKSIWQTQPGPDKGGIKRGPDGKPTMEGARYVPYHLDELVAARAAANGRPWRVFVVEGEMDADRLREWGIKATCNPGGAGKWRSDYNRYFAGADVIVIADNDASGRRHAAQVATAVLSVAARVRLLELQGLPERGDITDWLDRGGTPGDLEDLIDALPSYEIAPTRHRFTLVRFKDIEIGDTPRCVVEELVPCQGLVVVWGEPKCGKSFFVFDLVMHVALGREYRGRRVEQGTVVYIAAEGELGIKARVVAFRQARMAEADSDPPLYLLTTRLDLVEEIDLLIAELANQLPDGHCSVIVIDTLNRTIHGSESRDEDMTAYRCAADRLREEFNCAVIIIHHCGVDGSRPRGHSSLTGAVDAQLAVKREGERMILATAELMKDGPTDETIACQLAVVEVGLDRHGKPITSCVIEHLEAPGGPETSRKKKLSPAQQRALDLLGEAITAAGEVPSASSHIPAATACVTENLWREYCARGGISSGEGLDAVRKAFNRAAEVLLAKGRIGKWDPWVWLA